MPTRHKVLDAEGFVTAARAATSDGQRMTLDIAEVSFELEPALVEAVLGLVDLVHRGVSIQIDAMPAELTTGQAADILGVSRPTVTKLIDNGQLPSTRVGTHRRVLAADVFAFRERSRSTRRRALDELVALSDELGLYGD